MLRLQELIVNGVVWETATTHTQISGVVLGMGTGVFVSLMGGLGVYTAYVLHAPADLPACQPALTLLVSLPCGGAGAPSLVLLSPRR